MHIMFIACTKYSLDAFFVLLFLVLPVFIVHSPVLTGLCRTIAGLYIAVESSRYFSHYEIP